MKRAAFVLLVLASCATAPNPLVGGWSVDFARTQEELARAGDRVGANQRELMSEPAFFGDMSYVFDQDTVWVVLHGECTGPLPYRFESKGGDALHLVFEERPGKEEEVDLRVGAQELRAPMGGGMAAAQVDQVFTRTTPEAIASKYPCVRR